MLEPASLRASFPIGDLGEPLYFFSTIGSTNEYARELAGQGAPHGTMVIADEQTAGRGRHGRTWATPAGSALALSLVSRPISPEPTYLSRLNLIGPLAVARALERLGTTPQVKWPNDVLLDRKKVAGILVEAAWNADELSHAVIGIGVNIRRGAVPPEEILTFPATSVDEHVEVRVDREALLVAIVGWLSELMSYSLSELASANEARLAFLGEPVGVETGQGQVRGTLLGLTARGYLRLAEAGGRLMEIGPDAIRMRPIDSVPE